jgi:hypothetical protein
MFLLAGFPEEPVFCTRAEWPDLQSRFCPCPCGRRMDFMDLPEYQRLTTFMRRNVRKKQLPIQPLNATVS